MECKLCGKNLKEDRVCRDCGIIMDPPEEVKKVKSMEEEIDK